VRMDGVVEIITGRERRRRWSTEDKLRLVTEMAEPGTRVRAVAARHGVCESLLFTWRRQVRDGVLVAPEMPVFIPVQVLGTPLAVPGLSRPEPPPPALPPASSPAPARAPGRHDRDRVGRWPPGAGGCGREPGGTASRAGGVARMIPVLSGVRVWLAVGATDMRNYAECLVMRSSGPGCSSEAVHPGRRGSNSGYT